MKRSFRPVSQPIFPILSSNSSISTASQRQQPELDWC